MGSDIIVTISIDVGTECPLGEVGTKSHHIKT